MQRIDQSLITPIFVKESDDMPWPEHRVFYLLTGDNIYICRNDRYFRSCVPARLWPTELARHVASLVPKYPLIPQEMIERICGFFGHMSDLHGAEAIVLLAWDNGHQQVRTIVPEQVAAVSQGSWGTPHPIGVKYKFPHDLPRDWDVFCDIHSHCEMAAYASHTDVEDEDTLNGLHIVVGRLHQEPPEFHAEAVVDGTRFAIAPPKVIAGYQERSSFPSEWLEQATVTNLKKYRDFSFESDAAPAITGPNNGDRDKQREERHEEPHDSDHEP
ncbi:MAG: hypothetical protein WBF93_20905 [Pirellulales bacterium]